MEKENATDTPPIAAETVEAPTLTEQEDLEAKYKQLEEEKENYRKAYLKEAGRNKATKTTEDFEDESVDDRMRKIAEETLANSRIVEIAREQDAIIAKALKENKELKLAHTTKTPVVPTSMGGHTEVPVVKDTAVTPEQLAYFKEHKWSDKDIERYKKNLQRNTR